LKALNYKYVTHCPILIKIDSLKIKYDNFATSTWI